MLLSVLDVVSKATKYGVQIMGDDFIGYKFIGEDGEFWNQILINCFNNDELRYYMSREVLEKHGHEVFDYIPEKW